MTQPFPSTKPPNPQTGIPPEVPGGKLRPQKNTGQGYVFFRQGTCDEDGNWYLNGGCCSNMVDMLRLFRHETEHLYQPVNPAKRCDPLRAHVKIYAADKQFLCDFGDWIKQNPPPSCGGQGCEEGFDDWLEQAKADADKEKSRVEHLLAACSDC